MARSKLEMQQIFRKLPAEEQWRFFIDGYRQGEGEGAFDVREPGYMAAMKNAFKNMMDSIDNPLTAQTIIQLHKDALTDVENTDNENLDVFRNGAAGDFGLVTNTDRENPALGNVSLEGVREFVNSGALEEKVGTKQKFEIYVKGEDVSRTRSPEQIFDLIRDNGGRFYCRHESTKSIEKTVNQILANYNQELSKANTDEDKLSAIIKMVSELERRHIFTDGNARTMVMLVLNRELVRNGFSPTVLNPNRFDLFSQDDLKKEVSVGMQMFWNHVSKSEIERLLQQEETGNTSNKTPEMRNLLSEARESTETVEEDNETQIKPF